MDAVLYGNLRSIEERHWWFIGRRAIVRSLLDRFFGRRDGRILEAGCGTGGNLALLSRYGSLSGFEIEQAALDWAKSRGIGEIAWGALPDDFPFEGREFDLAVLLDVLEHIQDDEASLKVIHRHLAPDGQLMLTVPALPSMWSRHDDTHHHFRRYTRKELRRKLEAAGFTVELLSYYNFFLLPAAWLARKMPRCRRKADTTIGVEVPHSLLNRALGYSLSIENRLLRALRLPVGLSLVAVARKMP